MRECKERYLPECAYYEQSEQPREFPYHHRDKERIACLRIVGIKDDAPVVLATAHVNKARSSSASVHHAFVWIGSLQGYGKAGGYGYCKSSDAIADALYSMGFRFPKTNVGGSGLDRVHRALAAAVRATGYDGKLWFDE